MSDSSLSQKQIAELIQKNEILIQKKQNNPQDEQKNETQIVNLKVKDNALNERNELKTLFDSLKSKLKIDSTDKEKQRYFQACLEDYASKSIPTYQQIINKLLLIYQQYPDSSVFEDLANVLCLHHDADFVSELDDSKLTKKIWTHVLVLCKNNPDLFNNINFYRLMLFLDTGLAKNGLRTYHLRLPLSKEDKNSFEECCNKNFGEFLIEKSISNMIASSADFEQRGFIETAYKVLNLYQGNITEKHKEMFREAFGKNIDSFIALPIKDIDSFVENCKKDKVALNVSKLESVKTLEGINAFDLSFAVNGNNEESKEESKSLLRQGFERSDKITSETHKKANSSPKSQKTSSFQQQ